MKKLMLTVILVLSLTACSCSTEVIQPREDTVVVDVLNNADYDIYVLELSWYNKEELKGSQGTMKAEDGLKLKKGELLQFELTEADLSLEGEVLFELTLIDVKDERKRVTIGEKFPLNLEKGKVYSLEISGEDQSNLEVLQLMNK
ncbi:hypothetical protein ACQCT5_02735 [Sutcliffiella halmapala]